MTDLSPTFKEQYGSKVLIDYDQMSKLTDIGTKVMGNSSRHYFPRAGIGVASTIIPRELIDYMNTSNHLVQVDTVDKQAAELISRPDLNKVGWDAQTTAHTNVVSALGRAQDALILRALEAGKDSTNVGVSFGASNSGLTFKKVVEAARILDNNKVPRTDRCMIISPDSYADLTQVDQFISSDYITNKTIERGMIGTILDFKIIMFADIDEGGLSKDGSDVRSNYALHKPGIGLFYNKMMMGGKVSEADNRLSWQVIGWISMNAVVLNSKSVIEVFTSEA